jgi:hypothetical protein
MRAFMPGGSGRTDYALYAVTSNDWRAYEPSTAR